MKYKVYNKEAVEAGNIELSDSVFALKPNDNLLHQAYVAQISNERQVLAHTKTRAEVRGGGKKPWKQKGTGRARAGSSRSPIWIGGGIAFGPRKDRNFTKKINLKMKRKAFAMVLSNRAQENSMLIIDEFKFSDYKTKEIDKLVKGFEKKLEINPKAKRSFLIINKGDDKLKYSGRNLEGVEILNIENLNIVDLLKFRFMILSKDAALIIDKRYAKDTVAKNDKE